jgi:hypothetical protein
MITSWQQLRIDMNYQAGRPTFTCCFPFFL